MVWVTLVLGLGILLISGDLLVRGAVNASLRLGVPALIVSLTIVAFGTSAPELLISVDAVLAGAPGLALGNVVGSNTANVLLVLGVPALISRLHTAEFDTRKSYKTMIGVTVFFIALCFLAPLTFWHGLMLLAVLAFILWDQASEAMSHRKRNGGDDDVEGADASLAGWKIATFLILGLVGLPLGASLFVDSSVSIAEAFGVSDSVIGLTLVAAGTSLPELATTVMAALRRQADVAMGNVIGSNMFNLLAIMGVTTLFGPVPVVWPFLAYDLWAMLGASLLLAPFVFSKKRSLTRRWGFFLFVLYLAYLVMVVMHG
ncbi:MAG: calcium/sodium antiporter [Paracoccaceae bacterium]|nr:calcium/sodium antiporter [Paracoccaceae bacterium]